MGKMAGLKRPGDRYYTSPNKQVEGLKKAAAPRKAQMHQNLTLQRG